MNDEDRERKAEACLPGTFNVIVNPDSFQHLAEYAADDVDNRRSGMLPLRRGSIAASLASSFSRDSVMEAVPIPGDPNIVILPRFEDLSRRSTRELRSPTSPTASARPTIKQEDSDPPVSLRSPEIAALRYFRDNVWKQLVPPEHGPDSSIVLLDEAAVHFPPVSHFSLQSRAILTNVLVNPGNDGCRISRFVPARRQRMDRLVAALFSDFARVANLFEK